MTDDGAGGGAVGYRSPPKHRQFKKGVSGNPLGRPRKSRNYRAVLLEEVSEPLKITVDGRKRTVSTFQVLVKRMKADALKGDVKARRDLFDLIEKHCPELFVDALPRALTESQQELMRRFVERVKVNEHGRVETVEKYRQLKMSLRKPTGNP